MADEKALRDWVKDRLHDLVGFSEAAVAQYVISIAKKHTSAASLGTVLQQQGIPGSFAGELLAKVNQNRQQGPAQSQAQVQAKQAREMMRKNATYGIVEESAEERAERSRRLGASTSGRPGTTPANNTSPAADSKKQQGGRQIRKPLAAKQEDDEDRGRSRGGGSDSDDGAALRQAKRAKRAWEEEEEAGDLEARAEKLAEAARLRDQEEMRAFEERLRQRDEQRTKKVAEDSNKLSKREQKEADKRKYTSEEERARLLPTLREVSRQEYLQKRADKKIQELEDEIADSEYLFEGQELTAKEKADLAYKKQLLALTKARQAEQDKIMETGYKMPDSYDEPEKHSKRYEAALARYKPEENERANAQAEQDQWEKEQARKTQLKAGAADAGAALPQYDLLLDDSIDFITADIMQGDNNTLFETAEEAREREAKARARKAQSERQRIAEDRASLPIYPFREEFLQAVEENQIVIIVAETGAGKTTQLPQYLYEAGYGEAGKIGCTQPRRVAAMSVAARVAHEMGVKLGNEVGYSIRFEDCTSDKTIVKYMTDGMLLREFLGEPDLASYSVMMIDEAHERTLHTDVLFGLVKDIARFRPDLKLLISSATLDADKFSEYFDYAPIFRVPGRRYPVDILYTKAPEADYIDAAVVTTLQIHATQPPGDILVFLTGQEEIEACEELLKQRTRGLGTRIGELIICPIYANLPSELQAKIFEPTPEGARKVVLATNIAETSLTIDGIKYVIDPGFNKQNNYNPRTGMESLTITPVSKASANQRAGRAGRTSAGKCFRLYTAWAFENELEENTVPEIQRTNLGNVVLMLKSLGIHDLMGFDFMDPPAAETLLRALESLYALGALNDKGELTKLGRRMAEFPLDPQLAKTLLASETYGVAEQVFADNAHKNFSRGNVGDHLALMNCYEGWAESDFSTQWCYENYVQVRSMKRARDIRDQLVGLMERVEIEMTSDSQNHDGIKKSIAAGFFYNTARLQKDGSYKTVKNPQTVHIHPSSSLKEVLPRWVVYQELVMTSKEYMRIVSEIKPDWLVEIAPHFYSKKDIQDEGKKLPKGKGRAAADPH